MKIFRYCNFFLLSFIFVSCLEPEIVKQEIEEKPNYHEYVIFGMFFGNCYPQDCIEIFKIQNDSLFKSDNTYPRDSLYSGEFEFMGNEKFPLVADFKDKIPSELFEIEDQYIGCPDCSDMGGYIIEYSTKDFQSNWLIDTRSHKIPEELHDFLDLTYEKIQILMD